MVPSGVVDRLEAVAVAQEIAAAGEADI